MYEISYDDTLFLVYVKLHTNTHTYIYTYVRFNLEGSTCWATAVAKQIDPAPTPRTPTRFPVHDTDLSSPVYRPSHTPDTSSIPGS